MLKTSLTSTVPSAFTLKTNKIIRFIKVGRILHLMAISGVILFFIALKKTLFFFNMEQQLLGYIWLYFTAYGFTLPFFAELDAYGRYQNYKQFKDALHTMGYDTRLIKPFINSRCQRDAILVAAADLNYKNEIVDYFYKKGYRWHHILPDAFIKNPLVLFKKKFWIRILFTQKYNLKYFYW